MKIKRILILATAALLAAACSDINQNKESSQPIRFQFSAESQTKGAEYIPSEFTSGQRIFIAASHKDGGQGDILDGNFLAKTVSDGSYVLDSGLPLLTGDGNSADFYVSLTEDPPVKQTVYYPLNGELDFLACTYPGAKDLASSPAEGWLKKARFNNIEDAAANLVVEDIDTDVHQNDFLWAASNRNTALGGSVRMEFRHAQALLIFNVNVPAGNNVVVDDIVFWSDSYVNGLTLPPTPPAISPSAPGSKDDITLMMKGTFFVNNVRNNLVSAWRDLQVSGTGSMRAYQPSGELSKSGANSEGGVAGAIKYGAGSFVTPLPAADAKYQLGDALLIPEQPTQDFYLFYHIKYTDTSVPHDPEKDIDEEPYARCVKVKVLRRMWSMGLTYIFTLDLSELQYKP